MQEVLENPYMQAFCVFEKFVTEEVLDSSSLTRMRDAMEQVKAVGFEVKKHIIKKLQVAEKIYHQQHKMYTQRTNRSAERIVIFARPYVRPIKRGKQGKKTEFGGKGALVYVGDLLFMDKFEDLAFYKEECLRNHLLEYEKRFGKFPPYVVMDGKYGTKEIQSIMYGIEVRASFKRRG